MHSIIVPAGSYTITEPRKVRISQESARLDFSAMVAPGTYPLFAAVEWTFDNGGHHRITALWYEAPGTCERSVTTQAGEVREITQRVETYWAGDASAKPAALALVPQIAIRTWDTAMHSPTSTDLMSRLELAAGVKPRVTQERRYSYSDRGELVWSEPELAGQGEGEGETTGTTTGAAA